MSPREIALRRLAAQHLTEPLDASAGDVVRMLAAVQAQDYAGAKWGVAQRAGGLTDAAVEQAFTDGELIRTHLLRPTWHFVAPEDLRWMLALSAPRIHAANRQPYKQLELDRGVFRRSHLAISKALRGGRSLTRAELAKVLARARLGTITPRHATFLVMAAELDGVVCSGPRRGKQFTYALLEERVPPDVAPPPARDEAMHRLALRYFRTRGPATAADFAWWSGLTLTDARRAAHDAEPALERETIRGQEHWHGGAGPDGMGLVHLLPSYDEYFIGFRDRSAMMTDVVPPPRTGTNDRLFLNVVTVGGQVAGLWRRAAGKGGVTITVEPLRPLGQKERRALAPAAARYAAFLGVPHRLETLAEAGG